MATTPTAWRRVVRVGERQRLGIVEIDTPGILLWVELDVLEGEGCSSPTLAE